VSRFGTLPDHPIKSVPYAILQLNIREPQGSKGADMATKFVKAFLVLLIVVTFAGCSILAGLYHMIYVFGGTLIIAFLIEFYKRVGEPTNQ